MVEFGEDIGVARQQEEGVYAAHSTLRLQELGCDDMRYRAASGLFVLALTVFGCRGAGGDSDHPKISQVQVEKDVDALLPGDADGSPFQKEEIALLEAVYDGDEATIVLTAGSIAVGSLSPADIDVNTPKRPRVASLNRIPWKLRLAYHWDRKEWNLRTSENLTAFDSSD